MGISETIVSTYNDIVQEHGTALIIYSGLRTYDADYGDVTITFPASGDAKGIFSYLKAKEIQFLPEGQRADNVMNLLVKTTEDIQLGYKVDISGTSESFEVVELGDVNIVDNSPIYKRARVKKL